MEHPNATDILKSEHRGIERMLDVVERAAERLQQGEPVPPALFAQAGEFFAHFADRCHHGKEEAHLFPALQRRGVPSAGGPIGQMLAEHDQGRAYVRTLREEARRHAEGTLADPGELVAAAHGYVTLLRAHIRKEDGVLFPLADRLLAPEEQAALVEAFDRVESQEMGAGEHERYHAMIDELAGAVLDRPEA